MEIQKIKISEAERELLFHFYGEDLGNQIDFNRLMPVVEKIEEVLLQVSIHTAFVNICGEVNGVKYNQDTCFESQNDTKLIVTHRAVLRAIQFTNSQSPETIK